MSNKNIVVITGSRAEWGLLFPVCRKLKEFGNIVKVLVIGSHVDENKEYSIKEVEKDTAETNIDCEAVYKIPKTVKYSDDEYMFNIIAIINRNLPKKLHDAELVVLLGDRYEIFSAASICKMLCKPIAHFCGGELTLGAFDDSFRHCITKLSDYHFVSNDEHFKRVCQLGENPKNVFNVGDLGLNDLNKIKLKSATELNDIFDFSFENFFLITVHPETCNKGRAIKVVEDLLNYLPKEFPNTNLLFTAANADPEGEIINSMLEQNKQITFIKSLGRINYLSAVKLAKCVIGNSSSAILEVPSLHTPAVNIGNRQTGRKHCKAVIDSDYSINSIICSINKALSVCNDDFALSSHGIDSALHSAEIITNLSLSKSSEKKFFDLF